MGITFNPFSGKFDFVGSSGESTKIYEWVPNTFYESDVLLYGPGADRDIYVTLTSYTSGAVIDDDIAVGSILVISPESIGTGVILGGLISIDPITPNTIRIESGIGRIVNIYDQLNRTSAEVIFNQFDGVVLPPAQSNQVSIFIDVNGQPLLIPGPADVDLIKNDIFLGRAYVDNANNIIGAIPQRWWGRDSNTIVRDFMIYAGIINSTPNGNVYGPAASNLQLSKTAGSLFGVGFNFNDKRNPNNRETPAAVPVNIRYVTRNEIMGLVTDLDPNQYDLGGVLTPVPIGQFTIQKIYLNPINITVIEYGEALYTTMEDAVMGLTTEAFVPSPLLNPNLFILRGAVIIKQGTLDNSIVDDCRFIPQDKFGQGGSTATSGGDVFGPAAATDNAIVRFDGTTGKIVQNSGVIISDTKDITGARSLTVSGTAIPMLRAEGNTDNQQAGTLFLSRGDDYGFKIFYDALNTFDGLRIVERRGNVEETWMDFDGTNDGIWVRKPLNIEQGDYIRFPHSGTSDTDDGRIGSGLFGNGLNIVGVQTAAGLGRRTRIWGNLGINADPVNAFDVAGNSTFSGTLTMSGVAASGNQRSINFNSTTGNQPLAQLLGWASGGVVGGNAEGQLRVNTMNGGWGFKQVFTTTTNSPPGVRFEGPITAQSYSNNSSRILKKNIKPIAKSDLDKFNKLKIVSFNWRDTPYLNRKKGDKLSEEEVDNKMHFGLIADDLEAIFPDMISTNEKEILDFNDEGVVKPKAVTVKGYDVTSLLALAIAKIQELEKRIEVLEVL